VQLGNFLLILEPMRFVPHRILRNSPFFIKERVGGWLPVITPDHPQPLLNQEGG